jgi:hypothetical protein
MASGAYDIEVASNENIIRNFSVSDAGVARDLTGYTAAMHIRSEDVLILDCTTYLTISEAEGIIALNVPVAEVALLTDLNYQYDIVLTETSSSDATRLLSGVIKITPGVTV